MPGDILMTVSGVELARGEKQPQVSIMAHLGAALRVPGRMTSRFERYLSVWVGLCIVTGIALGKLAPGLAKTLDGMAAFVHRAPIVFILIAICLFKMRLGPPADHQLDRVRLRNRTTANGSHEGLLTMVYKRAEQAEKHWRRLNKHEHIALVIRGVQFGDDVIVKAALENLRWIHFSTFHTQHLTTSPSGGSCRSWCGRNGRKVDRG